MKRYILEKGIWFFGLFFLVIGVCLTVFLKGDIWNGLGAESLGIAATILIREYYRKIQEDNHKEELENKQTERQYKITIKYISRLLNDLNGISRMFVPLETSNEKFVSIEYAHMLFIKSKIMKISNYVSDRSYYNINLIDGVIDMLDDLYDVTFFCLKNSSGAGSFIDIWGKECSNKSLRNEKNFETETSIPFLFKENMLKLINITTDLQKIKNSLFN